MSLTEAFERRPSGLHGIKSQLHTVAEFWGWENHDSLEDAYMTALVYEQFLEFDPHPRAERTYHNPSEI